MAQSTPQAFANWKEKQRMKNESTKGAEPGIGHNSAKVPGAELRAFVERVERLEEEKKGIADDIRDVFAEAKGKGFDVGAMRAIIKERKIDPDKRAEQEQIRDLYREAMGMLA
jgi:uncharacterized protein (UPF0335 family)